MQHLQARLLPVSSPSSAAPLHGSSRLQLYWSVYIITVGVALLFVPNLVLYILLIPATEEPFIRILGLILISLGWQYAAGARNNFRPSVLASCYGRIKGFVAMNVLAYHYDLWQLSLFGLADIASAAYTYRVFRGEQQEEELAEKSSAPFRASSEGEKTTKS